MFLCITCETAEAPPVKILATWTLAEAAAGGTPKASSTVLAITP